ncbi:MAG: hypothetical protein OXK17_10375 [Thaumarchaeota archaeon]|nr:hypothetical protein [Nitrososphaerota archaeon]
MHAQPLPRALDTGSESVRQFLKGFHSEATKVGYARKLCQFLDACGMTSDDLLAEARGKPASVQRLMIDYVEERKGQVSGSTINQVMAALKHFFEMNDAEDAISWRKIAKVMPRVRKTGSDRAPTIQEIRQMLDAADMRLRCIILTCVSSGVRVGAFEDLCWGDVTPMAKDGSRDEVSAARIAVYRGSVEEYVTFVSPECYDTLLKYRAMREDAGERVTDASPLIRDSWDSHPYRKAEEKKDPAVATPLASKTISNMMFKFLNRINMRNKRHAQAAGHEFKQIHGFRKYFKTNAERTMKTIDVEKLMGHAEVSVNLIWAV